MFKDSIGNVLKKMRLPYTLQVEDSNTKMYLIDVNAGDLHLNGGIIDKGQADGRYVSISFFFEIQYTKDLFSILSKVNELNDNGNVGAFIYDKEDKNLVFQLVIPKINKSAIQEELLRFYLENVMIVFRDSQESLLSL